MGASLLVAYLLTMAPGLTWANGGSDGGDLIAAAATGGVAHPTGYPVYLLIARLFQFLPIGTLAFRTNVMSAVCTIGASLLVYAVVQRELQAATWVASLGGAVAAGLAFGLAPVVWSQAIITEVYGLNLLFIGLLLYLLTFPGAWSWRRAGLVGLVQGIAVGNQILAALLIPATLVCAMFAAPDRPAAAGSSSHRYLHWRGLGASCAGLILGLSSYLVLPLRAASHPPVNWGDPVTANGFFWLVSGKLYQNQLLHVDLAASMAHLQAWASLTLEAFGVLGLIAGVAGLIVFFRPSRLYALTIWIAIVYTAFAIQYKVADSFVYLLPTFLAFSVWIGLGAREALRAASRLGSRLQAILGLAFLGYLVFLGVRHVPQVNAAQDLRAEQFGQYVMSNAPARALLFTQTDRVVLGLRYFHFALHERPDVVLIANDLLPFDWYRDNLEHTYPDLVIPAPSTDPWLLIVRGANPERPACYVYSAETPLICE